MFVQAASSSSAIDDENVHPVPTDCSAHGTRHYRQAIDAKRAFTQFLDPDHMAWILIL